MSLLFSFVAVCWNITNTFIITLLHKRVGKKKHKQNMRIRKEPCPPSRHIIGCTFLFFLGEGGEKEKEKRKQSHAPHDMKLQTVNNTTCTLHSSNGRLVSFTKLHCSFSSDRASFRAISCGRGRSTCVSHYINKVVIKIYARPRMHL